MESKKEKRLTTNDLAVMIQGEFVGMNKRFDKLEEDVAVLKEDVSGLKENILDIRNRMDRIERKQDAEIARHDNLSLKSEDHEKRLVKLEMVSS